MILLALVVVELFTSQGCSSCPPADALLASLDKDPNVIVLSEHVDYWNYLGWRDPFSSSAFSERQQRYARRFGQDGPYTPQMIVDGQTPFVGSDARQARAAIAAAGKAPSLPINIQRHGENVTVSSPPLPKGRAELWIALVRPEGAVDVPRGENAGRMLKHVGIVRSLTKAGTATQTAGVTHTITTPPPEGGGWRVVAFLQEPGQGRILGSARN
jgi:hypothetical protein